MFMSNIHVLANQINIKLVRVNQNHMVEVPNRGVCVMSYLLFCEDMKSRCFFYITIFYRCIFYHCIFLRFIKVPILVILFIRLIHM